uniref:Ig-like domain-containing protein n=1 Tax=Paramormyrops kingsleyae TaxID=1676925 RepID=A0A3B3Q4B4_9TELE
YNKMLVICPLKYTYFMMTIKEHQPKSSFPQVTQKETELSKKEGETASLECTFSTSSTNYWVHWYLQYPGTAPQFILFTGSGKYKERFNASLDKTAMTVSLTVQNVQLSDSAVYYCALRPTVRISFSHPIQKHLCDKTVT